VNDTNTVSAPVVAAPAAVEAAVLPAAPAPRAPRARKPAKAAKADKGRVVNTRPLPTANITHRSIAGTVADVSEYTRHKTANGNVSLHNGDKVAKALAGNTLDQTYSEAARALGFTVTSLKSRYGHLNPGMQRMNLGNLIRGAQRAGVAQARADAKAARKASRAAAKAAPAPAAE